MTSQTRIAEGGQIAEQTAPGVSATPWAVGDVCQVVPVGAFKGCVGRITLIGANARNEPFYVVQDEQGRSWHREAHEITRAREVQS